MMGEPGKAFTSLWVSANAGSGKTYLLTSRVVRLLLLGARAESILCITYTKAAASEMRQRILNRLRKLFLASDTECCAELEALLGEPPNDAQYIRARALYGELLDSPGGGVQITTMHGFCQSLLQRFPLEAGISAHFNVLEEHAAAEILRTVKHALLRDLQHAHPALREAITLLSSIGGEWRFDDYAEHIITTRGLWKTIWRGQSEASLKAHLWQLHELKAVSSRELQETTRVALNMQFSEEIRTYLPELAAHKNKTCRELGEALAQLFTRPDAAAIELLKSALLTNEGEPRKRLLAKDAFSENHPLRTLLAKMSTKLREYYQQQAALACVEETFAVAVFARALLDLYAQAKADVQALDYDDLIDRALMLVHSPETIGWVMSKLDHRLDHLLIDEAQDNSSALWQLVRTLVEELIASDASIGAQGVPRSLTVVGDEKQSIYSFQGAAPAQFGHYQTTLRAMMLEAAAPLQHAQLLDSYRSAPAILTLVNALCAQEKVALALGSNAKIHRLTRHHARGYVALYPILQAPEKHTPEPYRMPVAYENLSSGVATQAERIADEIETWFHPTPRWLESESRPLRPEDILILVHRRRPVVPSLIHALERKRLPVAGLDRLVLNEHLAVRDLLALMAWCIDPNDDLSLAHVLRSPLLEWSDEKLRKAAYGRVGTLRAQIHEPWLEEVYSWRGQMPYEFLTNVLEVSDKRRIFAKRFGAEVHEVLDALKEQAAAMPTHIPCTLTRFHAWIVNNHHHIKRELEGSDSQGIRIMTVHGAKGLEAPVVILVDLLEVPTTQKERIFEVRNLEGQVLPALAMSEQAANAPKLVQAKMQKTQQLREEYHRLLYVAVTRAREELHVFAQKRRGGEIQADAWYARLASAMEYVGAHLNGDVLELRDESLASTSNTSVDVAAVEDTTSLPEWAMRRPNAEADLPERLRPSLAFEHTSVTMGDKHQQTRGVRIHRILEQLNANADYHVIEHLVRTHAPDWSTEEQADIAARIHRLHAQERWLWEGRRAPEVSLAGMVMVEGIPKQISGQVDLLIERQHEIILIDFKTGARRESEALEGYHTQLALYRALVREIYPSQPIRCAIVWVQSAQVDWLDEKFALLSKIA